eukprot:CAMPEP_0174709620 /NCGR_PEP_ID=MMETSP1094-20130205/11516_1 /TAXON_ID=156173 /ORGANISM="Chrysochromulina brevifilum, Strain UTEX LB 985" /LENGTH=297 /DNA_ID=CAMNT_0015908315 /DNA_START=151 /DNA_END=1044 /DNA_ORIENTATION=+
MDPLDVWRNPEEALSPPPVRTACFLSLPAELLNQVVSHIKCTRLLHRLSSVCTTLRYVLNADEARVVWNASELTLRSETTEDDGVQPVEKKESTLVNMMKILRRAPIGARIFLVGNITLPELTLCAPIYLSTRDQVDITRLVLAGDGVMQGTIEGLHFNNWDADSVRVQSGSWRMLRCYLASLYPRRAALATSPIVMMHGSHLSLHECHVQHCKHAVHVLEPADLQMISCLFQDLNAGVRSVCGGGDIRVEGCTFYDTKRAFHFDPHVRGYARSNTMQCEPFGDVEPPEHFHFIPQL